jgi:hypothetical protein
MGLDTYAGAHRPTEDELLHDEEGRFGLTAEDDAAFESIDGSYFRGKIYDELVRKVTGVSLYQEWIPPETVRFMADMFEDRPDAKLDELLLSQRMFEDVAGDLAYLSRFFRVCAERRLGLVGSW